MVRGRGSHVGQRSGLSHQSNVRLCGVFRSKGREGVGLASPRLVVGPDARLPRTLTCDPDILTAKGLRTQRPQCVRVGSTGPGVGVGGAGDMNMVQRTP